jgi:hypothetical protein
MTKKDYGASLRKTVSTQQKVIADRFAVADSPLLNVKPTAKPTVPRPATQPSSATAVDPSHLVTRDTFSMPSGDYALIKQLRLVAARQGRNTNKSEVVRAGLRSLLAVKPSDLVALLDGLEKVKPGRK